MIFTEEDLLEDFEGNAIEVLPKIPSKSLKVLTDEAAIRMMAKAAKKIKEKEEAEAAKIDQAWFDDFEIKSEVSYMNFSEVEMTEKAQRLQLKLRTRNSINRMINRKPNLVDLNSSEIDQGWDDIFDELQTKQQKKKEEKFFKTLGKALAKSITRVAELQRPIHIIDATCLGPDIIDVVPDPNYDHNPELKGLEPFPVDAELEKIIDELLDGNCITVDNGVKIPLASIFLQREEKITTHTEAKEGVKLITGRKASYCSKTQLMPEIPGLKLLNETIERVELDEEFENVYKKVEIILDFGLFLNYNNHEALGIANMYFQSLDNYRSNMKDLSMKDFEAINSWLVQDGIIALYNDCIKAKNDIYTKALAPPVEIIMLNTLDTEYAIARLKELLQIVLLENNSGVIRIARREKVTEAARKYWTMLTEVQPENASKLVYEILDWFTEPVVTAIFYMCRPEKKPSDIAAEVHRYINEKGLGPKTSDVRELNINPPTKPNKLAQDHIDGVLDAICHDYPNVPPNSVQINSDSSWYIGQVIRVPAKRLVLPDKVIETANNDSCPEMATVEKIKAAGSDVAKALWEFATRKRDAA